MINSSREYGSAAMLLLQCSIRVILPYSYTFDHINLLLLTDMLPSATGAITTSEYGSFVPRTSLRSPPFCRQRILQHTGQNHGSYIRSQSTL
jgi:hypothetical protein